ncbi:MAG TPA: DUF4192 domain-containing protein [Candidatus Nanopelagicales bacterium]
MTATDPQLPPITCPSSLVASCAPLLGFTPERCLVAFVLGVPGRFGPVLVRIDLPRAGAESAWAEELAGSIRGTGGTGVDLVAWCDVPDTSTRQALVTVPALHALWAALDGTAIDVLATLTTNGRVCWLHDCPDLCCERPRPLDPAVMTAVQAEYVYAGYAPLGSREALAARVAPDASRTRCVARSLRNRRPARALERWRDIELAHLTGLLLPGEPPPSRSSALHSGTAARFLGTPVDARLAARAIHALADITVRDTLLLRLVVADDHDPRAWRDTIDLMADLTRCAPTGWAAPPATLLAIVAWMRGEGALASVALARAVKDDPGYRLAHLAREVIGRGMDPREWRRSMSGLTEAQCRGRDTTGG